MILLKFTDLSPGYLYVKGSMVQLDDEKKETNILVLCPGLYRSFIMF